MVQLFYFYVAGREFLGDYRLHGYTIPMSTVLTKATCRPAVFPLFHERESFPEDTLNLIYHRLVSEDLLADLCHDRNVTEEEFVKFVGEETLAYILIDLSTNQIAGIGWFDDIEESDYLKKARSAVAFFKEYQLPRVTEAFGKMLLSHAFNVLECSTVWGMTPASNVLVQRFCRRIGFRYVATIPNFCSRRGEVTDALICVMTREEFNAKNTPEEAEGG